MMLISDADGPGLFAINVFHCRPENQRSLIDDILAAAETGEIPGLRSMHLLRSTDGSQVVNVVRWADQESLRAASGHPVIAATREAVHRHIEGSGPVPHELIPVKPGP